MKKIFEPITKSFRHASEYVTKITMVTSKAHNEAIVGIHNKNLEKLKKMGILASYLLSPFSKITNPEDTSQFKTVEDPQTI